ISCVFFVQAEDGIRDRNVTGVQTCALPISKIRGTGARITASRAVLRRSMLKRLVAVLIKKRLSARPMVSMTKAIAKMIIAKATRSEERRVGKERRTRRAPESERE